MVKFPRVITRQACVMAVYDLMDWLLGIGTPAKGKIQFWSNKEFNNMQGSN
jgi:hypothetical protein